jgi:pilus assembly protein CpaE
MSNLPKPIMSPEELVGVGAPVGELGDSVLDPAAMRARPIPRISIQAFCENGATAEIDQIASETVGCRRRMSACHMGGIEAAVAHYQQNPTPKPHHHREQPSARSHPC